MDMGYIDSTDLFSESPHNELTSHIANAPELRTQNLSAAIPRNIAMPEVAPYKHTLPTTMFSSERKSAGAVFGGKMTTSPPDNP